MRDLTYRRLGRAQQEGEEGPRLSGIPHSNKGGQRRTKKHQRGGSAWLMESNLRRAQRACPKALRRSVHGSHRIRKPKPAARPGPIPRRSAATQAHTPRRGDGRFLSEVHHKHNHALWDRTAPQAIGRAARALGSEFQKDSLYSCNALRGTASERRGMRTSLAHVQTTAK